MFTRTLRVASNAGRALKKLDGVASPALTIRAFNTSRPAGAVATAAVDTAVHSTNFDLFTPTEEHAQLRATVRAFAEAEVEPQALEYNRAERFNYDLFKKLGDLGLLGITADPDHGGSGMDATAVVIAHEELSAVDPAFCLSFLAHSLLFVNNLNFNGTEAQKAAFLPKACTGELLGGMGMSEPGSGTDVLGMATKATLTPDGKYYELNGGKMWITNGAKTDNDLGDAFLVYARTSGGVGPKGGYSLFLVEKGMEGFSLGQKIFDKCGMRASNTAELVFDNVKVPAATHLVGDKDGAMICMMRNLEIERVALAAMSLGIARRSIEVMNKYAKERIAFGQSLNRFGQMQRHIGDSYAEYAAGRAYVYSVARSMDLARAGGRVDSDGVKLFCGPMATNVANRAMQVLGGNGYIGSYVVERLWRDAKLLEIGGGTNESHEKNITKDMARGPEKLA